MGALIGDQPLTRYEIKKRYQAKHPEARGREYRRAREWFDSLKAGPCSDCGVSYPPCVMQWDHVRGDKHRNVGEMMFSASRDRILKEIAKCDLVCANCHAIRTQSRRQAEGW